MIEIEPPDRRPVFTLRIEGKPGQSGIRALRALLKVLLRRHGFRCIDAYEEPAAPTNVADAFRQLRRDVRNRLRDRS